MGEVFVRIKKLPYHIRAFVMPDEEGDYNVYINEHLSEEAQKEALAHEMRHIATGDCYSVSEVCRLEGGCNA